MTNINYNINKPNPIENGNTIVVETLLFSEPRFNEAELGLPDDVPPVLLVGFPLDKDLCHITK